MYRNGIEGLVVMETDGNDKYYCRVGVFQAPYDQQIWDQRVDYEQDLPGSDPKNLKAPKLAEPYSRMTTGSSNNGNEFALAGWSKTKSSETKFAALRNSIFTVIRI
jgi:hypothetical protein